LRGCFWIEIWEKGAFWKGMGTQIGRIFMKGYDFFVMEGLKILSEKGWIANPA
jgi:hypothetical protein